MNLLAAAKLAFRETSFYSHIYRSEPNDVSEIPFISLSAYHRAYGILDCIVDREAMIGVIPPFRRFAKKFPFSVPEDECELVLRQQRILKALADVIPSPAERHRFLIIADEERGPFACEISKGLAWEGHQASICYWGGPASDLNREIEAYDPDYVILTSRRHLRQKLDCPSTSVVVVEHCDGPLIHDLRYPAWLYADEVDLIGSRPASRKFFTYDRDQLLLETESTSQLTHISKLRSSCFPLLRYAVNVAIPTESKPC